MWPREKAFMRVICLHVASLCTIRKVMCLSILTCISCNVIDFCIVTKYRNDRLPCACKLIFYGINANTYALNNTSFQMSCTTFFLFPVKRTTYYTAGQVLLTHTLCLSKQVPRGPTKKSIQKPFPLLPSWYNPLCRLATESVLFVRAFPFHNYSIQVYQSLRIFLQLLKQFLWSPDNHRIN